MQLSNDSRAERKARWRCWEGSYRAMGGKHQDLEEVWRDSQISLRSEYCNCQYYLTHKKPPLFLGHQSHKTSISQTIFQVSFASSVIDLPQGKNALHFSKQETYTLFSTNSSWNEHVHLCICKSFKFQSTVVLILVHSFGLLSDNIKLCCPEWCKLGTTVTNSICTVSPFL